MIAPVRVAMWSGPRNVSTALMRAWGSRADTAVCDEPLYAHYLAVTGKAHPAREEILASQPTDWREVAAHLTGPVPGGRAISYQKHMAHHLLPEVGRDWLAALRHAFLIRDPERMVPSLDRVTPDPTLADTGLPQQVELFEREADRLGRPPPVVDGHELLADPPRVLAALCAALGVPWDPVMLAWEPGPRETDGVWAPHWYAAVERTTGFLPPRDEVAAVPDRLRPLVDACRPYHARLAAHRLGS